MTKKMPEKQRLFAQEYIVDWDATKAAIRAGYSAKTASSTGSQLLKKPAVSALVIQAMQTRMERTQTDADFVLQKAKLLASFNINRFITVNDNGEAVYDFSSASDDDWYCISEYTVDTITKGKGKDQYLVDRVKLKSFDKLRALELVGKHIDVQAFRENLELRTPPGQPLETVQLSKEDYAEVRKKMINESDC